MNLSIRESLIWRSGEERGISRAFLARAYRSDKAMRATLVRLAREAGHMSLRYLKAARSAGPTAREHMP